MLPAAGVLLALTVSEVTVTAAAGPRDEPFLVAGEVARVGFRLRGGRGPYQIAVRGIDLMDAATRIEGGPDLEAALAVTIPAQTRSGTYQLEVAVTDARGRTARGRAAIEVIGATERRRRRARWLPLASLALETLSLSSGADGRAPRVGRLRRGERLIVEARVGGPDLEAITGLVILQDRRGASVVTAPLAVVEISPTRVLLRGELVVPDRPGRHFLRVETTDATRVVSRHREVVLE